MLANSSITLLHVNTQRARGASSSSLSTPSNTHPSEVGWLDRPPLPDVPAHSLYENRVVGSRSQPTGLGEVVTYTMAHELGRLSRGVSGPHL